jgi:hypothetical protein
LERSAISHILNESFIGNQFNFDSGWMSMLLTSKSGASRIS